MTDWQPIATAPRDGTPIWVIEDGEWAGLSIPHQHMAEWHKSSAYESGGTWIRVFDQCISIPTHWMPLPPPPKEAADG